MTLARSPYLGILLARFPLPFKLLILQFIWIIPYLFVTNYLERSLLPFRLLCYTDSDLLNVQKPIRQPLESCIKHFFPNQLADSKCNLNKHVKTIIEPFLPKLYNRVIIIRSAPGSYRYRNYIRNTWKKTFNNTGIPVIFVSGYGKNHINDNLIVESKKFNDVLQLDFIDSYKNLTLKMMATYSYFLRNNNVDQIIVVNDDTIVNKTALIADADRHDQSDSYMIGKVSRGYPRLIFPWLTWHVPSSMYSHMCYPPFIQGSSFIINRKAAIKMIKNICKFPFLHLDDVMAGIVSNCLNLKLIHREGFDRHILDRFSVYHYQYSRHSANHLDEMWQQIKSKL